MLVLMFLCKNIIIDNEDIAIVNRTTIISPGKLSGIQKSATIDDDAEIKTIAAIGKNTHFTYPLILKSIYLRIFVNDTHTYTNRNADITMIIDCGGNPVFNPVYPTGIVANIRILPVIMYRLSFPIARITVHWG